MNRLPDHDHDQYAFQRELAARLDAMTRAQVVAWAQTFRYLPKATTKGDAHNVVLRYGWERHLKMRPASQD